MDWNEQERYFMEVDSRTFHPDRTYEEYREEIIRYLMLCSWRYSRESAISVVEHDESYIRQAYADEKTVHDVAIDVGYACG